MNIEIRNLTKTFDAGVLALKGVNLTIPTGMYGLLGPNGAGKTTLMRILVGIMRPSSGQLRVGPYDLATSAGRLAVKRILGYLPQELGLYPDLSAAEFLDYVGILKGLDDRQKRRMRVSELLTTVGLADVAGRKLKGFSGGMQRRVGIAQALLNDPQLLIVDEPTAGLDPEERIRFRNLLVSLAGDRSVLLSTHIVEDVAQTSLRLAVLAAGEVVFEGETAQLLTAARGQVWTMDTTGPVPTGDLTVVSAFNTGAGMHYRIVSSVRPGADAEPTEPSLEDGYVALMRARTVSLLTAA
ncbi:MAG: ABC transporter ATP-binding protein [Candidatus Chloroheliales bacterium]|nr:MAG: ABC transporter ATP-binding protein [Chloroflexota bacterium]